MDLEDVCAYKAWAHKAVTTKGQVKARQSITVSTSTILWKANLLIAIKKGK